MNRKTIVVGALGLAVVLIVGTFILFRNTTTEVDADDVLARFDAATTPPTVMPSTVPTPTAPAAPAPATTPMTAPATTPATTPTTTPTTSEPAPTPTVPSDPSRLRLPEPGVYELTLAGSESIDLLSGASHDYPSTGFLTVTPSACGVELRFDFIAERWQTWTLCDGPDGPEITDEQIYHSFFGQADLVQRSCTDSPLAAGTGSWSCAGDVSIAEREVFAELGTRTTPAGDRDVLVVSTRLTKGDHPDNVETIEQWWDLGTGLPVYEARTYDFTLATPFGEAAYVEDYSFTLTSFDRVTG